MKELSRAGEGFANGEGGAGGRGNDVATDDERRYRLLEGETNNGNVEVI